ncbi:MAG TPA: YfhO family protein, partial [Thermoanaerobaculia bacterium]
GRAVVEPDARIAREKSLSGKSDYRHEILLDRPGPSAPGAGRPGLFVASLVQDSPERVVVAVENRSTGYLVLADAWYPGWRADVDGRRTEIFRADGMFRAVHIAPGSHRVAFVYRPVSVLVGAAVSVAAAVALAFLARRRPAMSRPA